MNRPKLIAGNWKMNLCLAEARNLAKAVAIAANEIPGPDVAIFPSYMHLAAAKHAIAGSRVWLGAQGCHEAPDGAHTGEVSVGMLLDVPCDIVLCGHSERRAAGVTDAQVAARARAALDAGLMAVCCVGETLTEREAGATKAVLARQLTAITTALARADAQFEFEIAYEPVWAIGTGKTATPEIAATAHRFIRGRLVEALGDAGRAPRILYGGSVKADNAADLLAADEVGGVLVGGAALDAASFRAIIAAGA